VNRTEFIRRTISAGVLPLTLLLASAHRIKHKVIRRSQSLNYCLIFNNSLLPLMFCLFRTNSTLNGIMKNLLLIKASTLREPDQRLIAHPHSELTH